MKKKAKKQVVEQKKAKKAYCRTYYQDNKERIKTRCKTYYQNNKAKVKAREKIRRDEHREERNETQRQWASLNRSEAYRRVFKSYLKRVYKWTIEQYEEQLKLQNGLCAICHLPPLGRGSKGVLVLDHDHKTGKVREFLCSHCNKMLGLAGDEPKILRSAISYLRRHGIR